MTILTTQLQQFQDKIRLGEQGPNNFSHVMYWKRPAFDLCDFFTPGTIASEEKGFYILPDNNKLLVDAGLKKSLLSLVSDRNCSDEARSYELSKTTTEGMTDYQIIPYYQIKELNTLLEIFATAAYLIDEAMNGKGILLSNYATDKQENVNLGYYEDSYGQMKVVFLEYKTPVVGEDQEFHIHETVAPRTYAKTNRYFLTRRI